MRNALPTITYPNHTTLITGVWPSLHGIAANTTFDPLRKNAEGWYWYFSDIKVPTLWSAVRDKGGNVADLGWPVSVGAKGVDTLIPEYWRSGRPRADVDPSDATLIDAWRNNVPAIRRPS